MSDAPTEPQPKRVSRPSGRNFDSGQRLDHPRQPPMLFKINKDEPEKSRVEYYDFCKDWFINSKFDPIYKDCSTRTLNWLRSSGKKYNTDGGEEYGELFIKLPAPKNEFVRHDRRDAYHKLVYSNGIHKFLQYLSVWDAGPVVDNSVLAASHKIVCDEEMMPVCGELARRPYEDHLGRYITLEDVAERYFSYKGARARFRDAKLPALVGLGLVTAEKIGRNYRISAGPVLIAATQNVVGPQMTHLEEGGYF